MANIIRKLKNMETDETVFKYINKHPGTRLALIYNNTPLGYQDVRQSLERLTKLGVVQRKLHTQGLFSAYLYHATDAESGSKKIQKG